MTGCSCLSQEESGNITNSCEGAEIIKDRNSNKATCVAYNKDMGVGVQAIGRCANFKGQVANEIVKSDISKKPGPKDKDYGKSIKSESACPIGYNFVFVHYIIYFIFFSL